MRVCKLHVNSQVQLGDVVTMSAPQAGSKASDGVKRYWYLRVLEIFIDEDVRHACTGYLKHSVRATAQASTLIACQEHSECGHELVMLESCRDPLQRSTSAIKPIQNRAMQESIRSDLAALHACSANVMQGWKA